MKKLVKSELFQEIKLVKRRCVIPITCVRGLVWTLLHATHCIPLKKLTFEIYLNAWCKNLSSEKCQKIIQNYSTEISGFTRRQCYVLLSLKIFNSVNIHLLKQSIIS